jgi:hypothetical protein
MMTGTDQVRPEDAGRLDVDAAHADAAVFFYKLSGENGALANELRKKHEFVTYELFKNYAHAAHRREHGRARDFAETLFMLEHGFHRYENAGMPLWDDWEEGLHDRAGEYTQGLHEEQIASAEL